MTLAHPLWLLAGIAVCAAMAWIWRRFDRRRRAALDRFVAQRLQHVLTQSNSTHRSWVKRALLAAAVAALFTALAEPQAGYRTETVQQRGNDVIFAVDTSRSMDAPDVKPSRLARAKLAIGDFVDRLNGDAVGLIAFAGDAFLQVPMTLDYGAFRESLNALDTRIIPRGGTNIASAIVDAQAAFASRPGSDKVLILITDGEDLQGDAVAAAKVAASQGVKIFTLGVGTAGGELIPLPAEQGGGYLRDSAGQLVESRLDEAGLRSIASATGGIYQPLGTAGQGLEAIYRQAIAPLAKHDLAAQQRRIPVERFQWPLAASWVLLIASLLIDTRRQNRAPGRGIDTLTVDAHADGRRAAVGIPARDTAAPERDTFAGRPVGRTASAALAAVFCVFGSRGVHASPVSAEKSYAQGDFSAAEKSYAAAAQRSPQIPVLAFNTGAAAYKAGEFPAAAQAFRDSLAKGPSSDSGRLAQQEDAYYNLGNTLYRSGQKSAQTSPQDALATWAQAVKSYDSALQMRPADADAKYNRDLVQRKIDALKRQQEQKSKEQKPNSGGAPQSRQETGQNKTGAQKSKQDAQKNASNSPQQSGSQQTARPQPQPGRPDQAAQGQSPGQTQQPAQGQPAQGQPAQGQPAQRQSMPPAGQGTAADRSEQGSRMADAPRVPGQMSPEEARELLDSLKNDERHLGGRPVARNEGEDDASRQPLKDW